VKRFLWNRAVSALLFFAVALHKPESPLHPNAKFLFLDGGELRHRCRPQAQIHLEGGQEEVQIADWVLGQGTDLRISIEQGLPEAGQLLIFLAVF
jgi:hypothetical protein